MIYTTKIQEAVELAVDTHEVNQKQKRKGKDVSYITHPLTVGLILARAGASEDVICAGILHDTVEDSVKEHKVTLEMIAEKFGDAVADLVESVTEKDKSKTWEERKRESFAHIEHFSHDSVLVKSADILSNTTEILSDHAREGEVIFTRFNAGKEIVLSNYVRVAEALVQQYPESPLAGDLQQVASALKAIT